MRLKKLNLSHTCNNINYNDILYKFFYSIYVLMFDFKVSTCIILNLPRQKETYLFADSK